MESVIRLVIGLVLLVVANVVLGSLDAMFAGTFDWKRFWKGVMKGAVAAACFAGFYAAGRLNPTIVAIDLGGESINLATAANASMVAAYALYAKEVFTKLTSMILSHTDDPAVSEGTASDPPDDSKDGEGDPPESSEEEDSSLLDD